MYYFCGYNFNVKTMEKKNPIEEARRYVDKSSTAAP